MQGFTMNDGVSAAKPQALSDKELVAVTRGYRLLHISRTKAVTGPGGPGDLAWIWPIATFFLLFWIWRPFRRRVNRRGGPHRRFQPKGRRFRRQ